MTRVLAFVDNSPCTAGVIRTAESLAGLVGAKLDVIIVNEPGAPAVADYPCVARIIEGEPESALLNELKSGDVKFAVLGSRSVHAKPELAGHVALSLMAGAPVPLVLVPPSGVALPAHRPRLLVPHDGTLDTTRALGPVADLLADTDAEVIFLHVFHAGSVPRFLDSNQDLDILAEEFVLQHSPEMPCQCELRIGDPALHILDVAGAEDMDAIVVAWQQNLSPGRAEIIRHLIRKTHLPLIVVPMTNGRPDAVRR